MFYFWIFLAVWMTIGFLTGVYVVYNNWKEGRPIKILNIFPGLIPVCLVLGVAMLFEIMWDSKFWNKTVIKGKDMNHDREAGS